MAAIVVTIVGIAYRFLYTPLPRCKPAASYGEVRTKGLIYCLEQVKLSNFVVVVEEPLAEVKVTMAAIVDESPNREGVRTDPESCFNELELVP